MECESPTQDHPTPKFAMPAVSKLSHTLLEEILHRRWIHAPVERLRHCLATFEFHEPLTSSV
eukprot:2897622-Rhodomonas_salina.1